MGTEGGGEKGGRAGQGREGGDGNCCINTISTSTHQPGSRILSESDGYADIFFPDIIEDPQLMADLHKVVHHR